MVHVVGWEREIAEMVVLLVLLLVLLLMMSVVMLVAVVGESDMMSCQWPDM